MENVRQVIKKITTAMLAGRIPNRHHHATTERKIIAE